MVQWATFDRLLKAMASGEPPKRKQIDDSYERLRQSERTLQETHHHAPRRDEPEEKSET